jgi:hypothetical protein
MEFRQLQYGMDLAGVDTDGHSFGGIEYCLRGWYVQD